MITGIIAAMALSIDWFAEKPSECERYAAEELTTYIDRLTGGRGVEKRFHLGAGRDFATDYAKLGPDGFRIRITGDDVYILADTCGQQGAGVLYGVYELLERFGGVRWYTSWFEVVPEGKGFELPREFDFSDRPAFDLREPTWYEFHISAKNAARNRCNPPIRGREKFGGSRHFFGRGLGTCHTLEYLVPPKEFFGEHPEYFALVKGERKPGQLCLANEDVYRIVKERVLKKIAEEYPKGVRYYGISQTDGNNDYCQCPECSALDEKEGTPFASILRFTNRFAEEVERLYPDVVIETLAYAYSSVPPKTMKCRDNVMPCVCTIHCDFSKPLVKSRYPKNISTVEEFRRWGSLTKHFYVWDYTTDFACYNYPFANVKNVLQENVKLFRDCGVTMLYEQGAYTGPYGDWAELKGWLLAKYLWNPDRDEKTLLKQFFADYYGPAAVPMAKAFNALHALERDEKTSPLRIGEKIEAGVIPDSFLEEQAKLYEEAAALVKGTKYARNVAAQRLSADIPRLVRYFASDDYGAYFCSRHPERIDPAKRAEMLAAAKRTLETIEVKPMPVVSESKDSVYRGMMKKFLASQPPKGPCDRLVLEDTLFVTGGGPIGYCTRAKDEKCGDGSALKFSEVSYIWHGDFDFSTVMTDPDGRYRLRARIRVDRRPGAPENGEVFWMGVYNHLDAKPSVGDCSIKVKDVKDGEYFWCEIGPWTPKRGDHLWSGGGRFTDNRANHLGVYIDRFELVREPEREPIRVTLSFDDGLKDHLLIVAPELEARGWRGTFNLVSDWIGKSEKMLSWADAAELIRRGHELAVHAKTHQSMTKLGDAEVRAELAACRDAICDHTGFAPRYYCPPYVQQDARTARLARLEGLEQMLPSRSNFGEGSGSVRDHILAAYEKGVKRLDILSHGICPVDAGGHGGWHPFPDKAAFIAHLDQIASLEREGKIIVTDYSGFESDCRLKAKVWPRHGVIALSFDDRNFADWEKAFPLFAKYGAKTTFFICGPIGTNETAFARRAMLEGHEIGLHGLGHRNADEWVAEHGADDYWKTELEPQLSGCRKAGLRPRSFAYPNCRRSQETDDIFRGNGFTRVRGLRDGVPSVTPNDPKNEKAAQRHPVAESDSEYRPALDYLTTFRIRNVLVGDYYHTDINDYARAFRRAGERGEMLSVVSHGISPEANGISMRTAWLDRMLAEAGEAGVVVRGVR